MNVQDYTILQILSTCRYQNQRTLADQTGYSLGAVNQSVRKLSNAGLLSDARQLTEKAHALFEKCRPQNAIILAAGLGMRMIPINSLTPKALLEVRGETLIERIIHQLWEAGVKKITVVVGFMKERFDYLIDEFGVKLVVNPAYAEKNNLCSLAIAAEEISNTYIIPGDLWFADNPFSQYELYSWYMVTDRKGPGSQVRVNRKQELVRVNEGEEGNRMVGLSYLLEENAVDLRARLRMMNSSPHYDGAFWEAALDRENKMAIPARVIPAVLVKEINTFEQLRELDGNSGSIQSDALDVISNALHCRAEDIVDISILKKGMTNRSFLFRVKGKKYIMRIPGEGSDKLINRGQEAAVFQAICGAGLCDDPVYLNPANGYKITKYLEGVRVCDPEDPSDLRRCMTLLKHFHEMRLQVDHCFDIFGQIEFYERLWNGQPSAYRDYEKTKQNVLSLRDYLDHQPIERCLTHIDAVPDNFLFYTPDGAAEERLQLTDWEYAGMQDPHVDIAMFCIYSLYDKPKIDQLIDIYFEGNCDRAVRAKIYCYIAACGLLWSNWTEYKRNLGVEFGEYGMRQYRYAKDFYRYALEAMQKAEAVK